VLRRTSRRWRCALTRTALALSLLVTLFAVDAAGAEHRILFVGNSYTDYGGETNVAGCYGPLASEAVEAWGSVAHETVAKGGWTFHQHAQDAQLEGQELFGLLGAGDTPWDAVVFQEQSQIPGFHPYDAPDWDLSLAAAPALDALAVAAGAETVFMMTWGRRDGDAMNPVIFPDYPSMQALLAEGYALYAAATSTPARQTWVAPVGMTWQAVWNAASAGGQDPLDAQALFSRLYSGDGSHPSQLGSYLMGLAMVVSLTGRDPGGMTWAPDGTSEADRSALRDAVRAGILTPPFETVDYGWGPRYRLPWLHAWEDLAPPDGEGSVTISHPVRRDTAVVDGAGAATSVILGGPDGARGRLVLQGEAALSVDEIVAGDGGTGSVEVTSGTLNAARIGVPVTLSGGGWILPAGEATLSSELVLEDGAALRFDLGSLPGEGALSSHLAVSGTAILDGRIYVVPAADLVLAEASTWDLVAAASLQPLPNLVLDGPDGATLEIVEAGAGQILRVTLPATGTPPVDAAPDVMTGGDVIEEPLAEVVPDDAALEAGAAPDTPQGETPGPEAVAEPAPPSGSGSGGCGVGTSGAGWWLLLLLGLGAAPWSATRKGDGPRGAFRSIWPLDHSVDTPPPPS
jgi:hypothetical protein